MHLQAVYGQIADYKMQLDEAGSKLEAAEQAASSRQDELEGQLEQQQAALKAAHTGKDSAVAELQQQLQEQAAAHDVSSTTFHAGDAHHITSLIPACTR